MTAEPHSSQKSESSMSRFQNMWHMQLNPDDWHCGDLVRLFSLASGSTPDTIYSIARELKKSGKKDSNKVENTMNKGKSDKS